MKQKIKDINYHLWFNSFLIVATGFTILLKLNTVIEELEFLLNK